MKMWYMGKNGLFFLIITGLFLLPGCGRGDNDEAAHELLPPYDYTQTTIRSGLNPPPLSESGIGEIRAQRPDAVFEGIDMAEFGRRWNAAAEHFGRSDLVIGEYELRYDNESISFRCAVYGENGGYVFEDDMGNRLIVRPYEDQEGYRFMGIVNRLWYVSAFMCHETLRLYDAYVWWGVGEIARSHGDEALIRILWRLLIYATHAHVGLDGVDNVLDVLGLMVGNVAHARELNMSLGSVEYTFVSQKNDPNHPDGDGVFSVRALP